MSNSEHMSALRHLLIETQFDHPDQKARRIDEFYSKIHEDPVERILNRIKVVYFSALERRTFWAQRHGEACVARAVAYQSMAAQLMRILDDYPKE